MKKILALALAALLVLSLAACQSGGSAESGTPAKSEPAAPSNGSEAQPASTADTSVASPNIDIAAILSGGSTDATVWSKQSEAVRQEFLQAAREAGVDASFGADGTLTLKDNEGNVTVQKSDGTWTYRGSDGTESQFGGEWPENEFTKLVPKPDFGLFGASTDSESFTVMFAADVTAAQIRSYAEKVKASGFDKDVEVTDQDAMGVTVYNFTASNAAGYEVSITYAAAVSGLTINK